MDKQTPFYTSAEDLRHALNKERGSEAERVALNVELTPGKVPDQVQLLPAGQVVTGRDGRSWINDNPQALIDDFKQRGVDLVVDWEHASEQRAPEGEEAPAAAWITGLELRDGSLWGNINWTPRAAEQVANREYRYLSPVFLYTRDSRRIVRLSSVGLTNQPNLALKALNRETPEEDSTVWEELLRQLGLPKEATEAQAIAALNRIQQDLETAKNREVMPSLDKFVPRADYNQALDRASNAEQKLVDLQAERQDEVIDKAINQALTDRKITPATVEYHKAQCRTEGGLDRFKAFVEKSPVIAPDSNLDGKAPEGQDKALNSETQKIAEMFGNSAEDLKTYGGLQ